MALQEELKTQGDYLFKYRSHLPLVLLALGLGLEFYQTKYTIRPFLADYIEMSALAVGILGLLIRIFTVGYTPKNTSGRNTNAGQVADVLNTKGIYSLIRNPLYVGNYFMWAAIAMLTGNAWFVLTLSLVFWVYYERIVYAEENFLRGKFGEVYLEWTKKTPIFLPTHFRYQKNEIPFSWRKILKKEKNGLFALFLIFWIFDVLEAYVATSSYQFEWNTISIGMVASGGLYVLLTLVKKFTKALNEAGR